MLPVGKVQNFFNCTWQQLQYCKCMSLRVERSSQN